MPKENVEKSFNKKVAIDHKWWKEAVVYQIYPRSFKDSDGDGIGDLKGIISKLDYIKSLGTDVIWLNPIFSSPNDDNGFDVSDYRSIMREYGTMKTFDQLLTEVHNRGLKLILDLPVNASSIEHKWFQESRKSKNNPYRNFYHWWPAEKGKPASRLSYFSLDSNAWQFDSATNSYYLHYFSPKQPELNWEEPLLREEIFSSMKFWLDKGIDGFRLDNVSFISKDTSFPPLPEKYKGDFTRYYGAGPHLHEYLREINKKVLSEYNVMSVGAGIGIHYSEAMNFVIPEREELNIFYHSEGTNIGMVPGQYKQIDPAGYSLVKFKEIYTEWDSIMQDKGWGAVYLGNHDQPRMLTRWGNDVPLFREQSSKLLTTFLFTMRSTAFCYNGDEIGMDNIRFGKIEEYRDVETLNMYKRIKKEGGDVTNFINAQKIAAGDNGRTPFQWNDSLNAGFSTGKPWMEVNPDYKKINVLQQEKDPWSILNFFRKLVKLRKENPALIYGKYELFDKENPTIYAYSRTLDSEQFLIVLNFSSVGQYYITPVEMQQKQLKVVIDNYGNTEWRNTTQIGLKPYEAVIFKAIK